MTSYETSGGYKSPLSQKALHGFREAAYNLSRYGELVRNGESPTFHNIAASGDVLDITTISLDDKPSHICTGEIPLPENDIRRNNLGKYMIYLPTEVGIAEPISLQGDLLIPALLCRWIGKSTPDGSSRRASMIDDTIISKDSRMFQGLSFEPHERTVSLIEFTTDFEVEHTVFTLEAHLENVAAAYPDVRRD
mgnify:CR=1 FL=1